MKACSKCGLAKPLTDFYIRKSGKNAGKPIEKCKACAKAVSKLFSQKNSDIIRARSREWRNRNIENVRAKYREWRKQNREKAIAATKKWRAANPTRDWYKENPVRAAELARVRKLRRYHSDPGFRLKCILRERIRAALNGRAKSANTMQLIGCSIEHLRLWLTFYFQPGMSWSNYGEWHIDHQRPCASFDLTDPTQQRECFHYTNLQPLWAVDNLSKSDKLLA